MSKIEEALQRARTERKQAAGAEGLEVAPASQAQAPRKRTRWPADERGAATTRGELVGVSAAEEIARMREEHKRDPAELAMRRVIDKDMLDVRVGDAFRHLRTVLLQKSADKNFILMVSSVSPGGGSSFVALNLAAAIAFDEGKTAMVLNCNLQNPSLDALAGAPAGALGLTDYLTGAETAVEKIIHPVGIPRLRLVPAGTQGRSAMEYFTAPQLSLLLRSLRQRYRERYIIVDAPPITEAADARILAELCDYTLLVVPYGRVTAAQIAAAAETIDPERLVGCVMNNEQRVPLIGEAARASARG